MIRKFEKIILFGLFILLVYRLGKATITLTQKENGWIFNIVSTSHPLFKQ